MSCRHDLQDSLRLKSGVDNCRFPRSSADRHIAIHEEIRAQNQHVDFKSGGPLFCRMRVSGKKGCCAAAFELGGF